MLNILNSDQIMPIEFCEMRLAGTSAGSTLRFTNAGEELLWAGETYYAVSFGRSDVREVLSVESGDQPSITLTFSNISRQMAELLNKVQIEGARVKLWTHDRRLYEADASRTRDAILLIDGEVRNPLLTEGSLTFEVVSILGLMDAFVVPKRVYQSGCNYTFGSTACGVNLRTSPNQVTATALSGSTQKRIRVSSTIFDPIVGSNDPTDFWVNGYIMFIDGDNAAQAQPISHVKFGGGERWFYMRAPFLNAPADGDGLIVRRGCPKTKEGCAARQPTGTPDNYGGFEEVPTEIKPVKIQGY